MDKTKGLQTGKSCAIFQHNPDNQGAREEDTLQNNWGKVMDTTTGKLKKDFSDSDWHQIQVP